MNQLRYFLEPRFFGVCTYLGQKLNMPTGAIRLFFIYSTFLAMGSPIIAYLSLAFVLKLRRYINGTRNPVWDL